jgi:hypothetical protein
MQTVSLLFHDVYAADPRESGFGSPAADRYKLPLGQFDEQLAGLALVRADAPVLVPGGLTTCARRVVVRRDKQCWPPVRLRTGPVVRRSFTRRRKDLCFYLCFDSCFVSSCYERRPAVRW